MKSPYQRPMVANLTSKPRSPWILKPTPIAYFYEFLCRAEKTNIRPGPPRPAFHRYGRDADAPASGQYRSARDLHRELRYVGQTGNRLRAAPVGNYGPSGNSGIHGRAGTFAQHEGRSADTLPDVRLKVAWKRRIPGLLRERRAGPR